MIGFVVINPEVLIARELERGGRYAPGLDFIRWRLAQLREEVRDDAEFWGIPRRDIALSRAAQLADARGLQTMHAMHGAALRTDSRSSAVSLVGGGQMANVESVKARGE